MQIFLSYASQDRPVAQSIALALQEQGHDVFFDRDDLPAGEEFHSRIRAAIEQSDLVVFLVSPDAVDGGSYTLTELEIVQQTWKRASGKLLPVIIRPTPIATIPDFVKSVTFLDTPGNLPASVSAAVHRAEVTHRRRRLARVSSALGIAVVLAVVTYGVYTRTLRTPAVPQYVANDGAPAQLIPGGSFVMGDDENSPRRQVYVDSFYIDRYEVTTARYAKFLAATGSVNPPDDWELVDVRVHGEMPVTGVDWNDANAYCAWAGRRLPSETEWERAARGDDARRFPWGNAAATLDRANYANASPETYGGGLTAVGAHPTGASPYGVDDLAGNVMEWAADWFAEGFAEGDTRNPHGPATGTSKVIRGGGRFGPDYQMDSALRSYAAPDQSSSDIGFRCARDLRTSAGGGGVAPR